jgi:glycosyl transferase family 25
MPAFVVNLDSRPDRLAAITRMLNALGIPFKRVSAVSGKDPSIWKDVQLFKATIYNDLRFPPPGQIACFFSHRKIWKEMVDSNIRQALVFEDDAEVKDFDPEVLNIDLKAFGLDQLRLEDNGPRRHNWSKFKSIPVLGRQAANTPTSGTAAYIVTLEGAKKFLRQDKFWFFVDHQEMWGPVCGINSAVLRPTMFAQSDSPSDIVLTAPQPDNLVRLMHYFLSEQATIGKSVRYTFDWAATGLINLLAYLPRRILLALTT